MDQRLSAGAVRIGDVIGDQQTRVRVEVHLPLITLVFAGQQNEVGQYLVAENAASAGRCVRPADRSFVVSGR